MRIEYSNLGRPKQAAKNLTRLSANLKLSRVHEILARVVGYRDWHDLTTSVRPDSPAQSGDIDVGDAWHLILTLADMLGLPYADVQHAISRARLLRDTPWSLDEQLAIRAKIWRHRIFGPPSRGKPGTIVREKAYRAQAPAYLIQPGRPTYLLFDTGMGSRADFEVATPRKPLPDFVPSRLWLPYGYWTLQDGSKVIFARDYLPMWRIADRVIERLDPWLWIHGITDQFHFAAAASPSAWSSGTARESSLQHLAKHRILELPKLVDVMPYLFESGIDGIPHGVARLHEACDPSRKFPEFATLNRRLFWNLGR